MSAMSRCANDEGARTVVKSKASRMLGPTWWRRVYSHLVLTLNCSCGRCGPSALACSDENLCTCCARNGRGDTARPPHNRQHDQGCATAPGATGLALLTRIRGRSCMLVHGPTTSPAAIGYRQTISTRTSRHPPERKRWLPVPRDGGNVERSGIAISKILSLQCRRVERQGSSGPDPPPPIACQELWIARHGRTGGGKAPEWRDPSVRQASGIADQSEWRASPLRVGSRPPRDFPTSATALQRPT